MLSVGPYSYNRFDAYEKSLQEASKPDYLDFDKDGNKKEPMKKAAEDKKEKMDEAQIRNIIRKLVREAMIKKETK